MNTKNKSKAPKYSRALRLRNGMIAIFCVFLLLIGRLFWLQFIKGPWLKEQMYSQLITSRAISPKRGTIYDTNGKELAISAAVDTVTINPDLIKVSEENKELEEIYLQRLTDEKNYSPLKGGRTGRSLRISRFDISRAARTTQ